LSLRDFRGAELVVEEDDIKSGASEQGRLGLIAGSPTTSEAKWSVKASVSFNQVSRRECPVNAKSPQKRVELALLQRYFI
jgi:hypothetical protein